LSRHLTNLERCIILIESGKEKVAPQFVRYIKVQEKRIRHRVRCNETINDWIDEDVAGKAGIKWPRDR